MKRAVAEECPPIVSNPGGGRVPVLAMLILGIVCFASYGAAQSMLPQELTPFPHKPSSREIYQPNFPRLGLIAIGYDETYPPGDWPTYAKFNVVILGGNWETWGDSRAYTREDVVKGIKAASSIGTKVFQYVDYEALAQNNPPNPTFNTTVEANNWWLYQNGTSGINVTEGNSWVVNSTHFPPPDAVTGLYPFQSAAKYSYDLFIKGILTYPPYPGSDGISHPRNAAPSLDGFFQDNVYWSPRVDGDWNRDGVTDSQSDPTVQAWYRTGERDFYNEILKLMPGKLVIANNADWPQASTTDPKAIAPLDGIYDGGVLEGVIGESFSVETYAGFNEAMAFYRYVMGTTTGPKLELFNQELLQPDGSDNYDATPYHAMRYGLCMALMNNGYYAGEGQYSHTGELSQIVWFDEYDGGGLGEGYLGQPVKDWRGAVQTHPRWNYGPLGVWAREFDGGIAIVNPKGNGSQTITLQDLGGPLWKHINGTQDPDTNNGQNVMGSITLADRDGIILLRRHQLWRQTMEH